MDQVSWYYLIQPNQAKFVGKNPPRGCLRPQSCYGARGRRSHLYQPTFPVFWSAPPWPVAGGSGHPRGARQQPRRSPLSLLAYRWAWADGEPYVNRYELTKTTELLQQMNVPIPNLPPYDPAKDEPFPWEADVRAAIEKLRVEKAANNEKRD